MTKLKIKVTKEVLRKSANCGVMNNTKTCAIALAVRDIFPMAYVYSDDIYPFDEYNPNYRIILPKSAMHFIEKFDKSNPEQRLSMPEIEFEINIPDSVIEKINIDEIRLLLINHPTLEFV